MRPLAASLVFIVIAMIVGVFRQLLFTNTGSNSDDSNISLTKLHTLTVSQHTDNKFSYNSLYQALYKSNDKKEAPMPLPYNSFALKKSILNSEDVYICDQKFSAIFEQNTFCSDTDSMCRWKTIISVYRLPYFKKQQEKVIEIEGRIMKSGGFQGELDCIKKQHTTGQQFFQINFAVLQRNRASKKGALWTMNSLTIEEQTPIMKNSSFVLKILKWNLKNVYHYPKIYNYDSKCLSYVTEEEPWLVNFNCGKNWSSFNVLNPKVQEMLFSKINSTINVQPPFSTTHYITPLFLQTFKSSIKNYMRSQGCNENNCEKQENTLDKSFVTYVFEIVNSHYLLGSTVAQLTIAINSKTNRSQHQGLVSHDILSNELNPEKKVNLDCSIQTKNYKIIKGLYNYQLGSESEDHTITSLNRHSLLCICTYNYNENIKIIEIEDLFENINMTALNIPGELLIRSQDQLQQNKVQNIVKNENYQQSTDIEKEDDENSWLDYFDFSLSKYMMEEELLNDDGQVQSNKKTRGKNKKQDKKQEKKKNKKSKKQKKDYQALPKIQDDRINSKLKEISRSFEHLGSQAPFQASTKIIQFPMPFTLTSDSKFKIVYGDTQYPLIYIETLKKYLLTYQFHEEEDPKNKSKKIVYTYKYSEIGAHIKSSQSYIRISNNDSKIFKKKDEVQLDRYLLDIIPRNADILNQVKSIRVVDARYEDNIHKYGELIGMKKQYRKQVIVAWGWGIEVYEVNWDKKGIRNQLTQLQQLLNSNDGGVQMLTLLPFIQLFATVYCLFQTLVSPR